MQRDSASTIELGGLRLDLTRGELLTRDGEQAPLRRQALLVLLALARRAGHVVSKDELIELVWPGKIVTDDSLMQAVADIRRVLEGGSDRLLRTIPRRGYLLAKDISASPQATSVKLYGREDALAELGEQLAANRLVTLTGPGGIGKTCLAEALVATVPDAVSVDLSTLQDPELVDGAVAAAFGLSLSTGPGSRKGLVASLAPRHGLLFVDNCEHLADACASLLQELADGAPGLKILATSRVPLRTASEQVFKVEGLRYPSAGSASDGAVTQGAVALFIARARAADHRFVVDETSLQAAIDICRFVEGLPLGIEMAAAQVGAFGATALAELMAQHRQVLGRGNSGRPPRQRTLEALYGWSYQLLDECGQAVFRRISVFPGTFDLTAAEAIVSGGNVSAERVAEGLAMLVEHSLLAAVHGSPPKWRLHATAREAARSLMKAAGESRDTSERHLHFLIHAYETLFERWFVMSDAEWRDQTDRLQDDLRAALTWATGAGGDAAAAASLLGASLPDWQWRNFQEYYEGSRWCAVVEGQSPSIPEPRPAARWFYLQSVLMPLDASARRLALQEAEREALRAGDVELQVQIRMDLAEHAHAKRAFEEATALLEDVASSVFGLRRGRLQGYHHFLAGQVAHSSGRYLSARESYLSAQRLLSNVGAECLALHAELEVGRALWDLERLDQALECLGRVAAESSVSRFGDDHVNGFALLFAAGVHMELGQIEGAIEHILLALQPLRRTGYARAGLHIVSAGLALIGEVSDAVRLVRWSGSGRARAGSEQFAGRGLERLKSLRDATIGPMASLAQTAERVEMDEETMLTIASLAFGRFAKHRRTGGDDGVAAGEDAAT